MTPLILASTSVYRRDLLSRLRLPFETAGPETDETPLPGETPTQVALRLSEAKARAVATALPGACVIGSDQVAELDGHSLGKPGDRAAAIRQLTGMSGREVLFRTGLCVVTPDGAAHALLDTTTVRFRVLSDAEIQRYVDAEQPYDCAGSFKSEGLGIGLFDAIESSDPTALIGLPMIATARLLRQAGYQVP